MAAPAALIVVAARVQAVLCGVNGHRLGVSPRVWFSSVVRAAAAPMDPDTVTETFTDALWMERGLASNTLSAYLWSHAIVDTSG